MALRPKPPPPSGCGRQLLSALGLRTVSLRQDGEAQQRLAERPLPQEVAEAGPDMVRPGETERERQPYSTTEKLAHTHALGELGAFEETPNP